MAVARVVALGRLPHLTAWQTPGAADRDAIGRALADTDVAHLGGRRAGSLSGGEHARVMLARARILTAVHEFDSARALIDKCQAMVDRSRNPAEARALQGVLGMLELEQGHDEG